MHKHESQADINKKYNPHQILEIFKTAVEISSIATAITDEKGFHLWGNSAFFTLFGFREQDICGRRHDILLSDPSTFSQQTSVMESGTRMVLNIETTDKKGRGINVNLTMESLADDRGRPWGYIWIYEDMTERKKIRKELTFKHEYLSTLHTISLGMFRRLDLYDLLRAIIVRAAKLTYIPNGFLLLYDPDQDCLTIRAACGTLEKYVGLKIKPDQGIAGRVFKTGEPLIIDDYQNWPGRLEGDPYENVHAVVCIPFLSGSKIEGVIGLTHDTQRVAIHPDIIGILEEFSAIAKIAIDNAMLFGKQKDEFEKRIVVEKERKEIESKLYQVQRMESIAALAGGIAHDFNNILSSIMGFTQAALEDIEKGSRTEDDLLEVLKASNRARDLVQQILTFARQSDKSLNAVKASLIGKEVLKFIRSSIPTTIEIKQNILSHEKVLANPTQLYQIFLNLFTNAAQAMTDRGGTLQLDMENEQLHPGKGPLAPGEYIKIRIADTGCGIEKKDLLRIFDPYFTTKKVGEGTGLGLSVVHDAVKGMKGDIRVKSEPGRGTVFTIYLPVSKQTETPEKRESLEMPKGNGEKILFVDDDSTLAKVGKRMLETLNYDVTAMTDSLEALDAFRSAPEAFDTVVTDFIMPNLTGDKLAFKIHEIRPDIPVILCTGLQEDLHDKQLNRLGLHSFYKKPISKYELATALCDALKKKSG